MSVAQVYLCHSVCISSKEEESTLVTSSSHHIFMWSSTGIVYLSSPFDMDPPYCMEQRQTDLYVNTDLLLQRNPEAYTIIP